VLGAALLLAGLATLTFGDGSAPAGGLAAAEAVALGALGGGWLGSLPVRLVAILLVAQVLVRLAVRWRRANSSLTPTLTLLAVLSLGLTLGATLWDARGAVRGELRLRPGEDRESCDGVVSGQPIPLHLGRWVRLVRWDPAARAGEVAVRAPGGKEQALPVRAGEPLTVGDFELVPVAQRPDLRPVALHLQWHPRAGGQGDTVVVRPGEHVHLDAANELAWEDFEVDMGGLGPAVLVVHHGPEGVEDRRWLLLEAPEGHEERQRTGPIVLRALRADRGTQLVVRVRPAGPGWPALLGLLLVVGVGLVDAGRKLWPGRRSPKPAGGWT